MASLHPFCLDFSSALLANILHASSTLELLESNPRMTQDVMNSLLSLLNDDDMRGNVLVKAEDRVALPTSTIIHLLICLSYLSKERFVESMDACYFNERIQTFVELFS